MHRAAASVPWKGSGCQQGPRGSGNRAECLSEVPGWLFCSVDPPQLGRFSPWHTAGSPQGVVELVGS